MSVPKILIDTNVFIGLEDDREIHPRLSALTSLSSKHGVPIFVHEATRDDLLRDKDASRRLVSLSKREKFQRLRKIKNLTEGYLAQKYGSLSKPNDVVDAILLHSLDIEAVDFLITEDRGLHKRARREAPHLSRRVLFIADAVLLLQDTYESKDVPLRYIEELKAYEIPQNDDIFNSLRGDYPEFDDWWREKCVKQHRDCWVVFDEGIAGLIVRKDEVGKDTDAITKAPKILKICTFKVKTEKRGAKLGELLLRKLFWFAQRNAYDLTYLTVYEKQSALIDLLEYYGFTQTGNNKNGEIIYEKKFSQRKIEHCKNNSKYDAARLSYPRFYIDSNTLAYTIPIKENYHDQLFPELKTSQQPDFFEMIGLGAGPKTPGNTIRKVYLCRAQMAIEEPGSLLFFYKGKSKLAPSQAITAIGIFEDMALAHSTAELRMLAGGRSVYSDDDIVGWDAGSRPVKVINFLLVAYLEPPASLSSLKSAKIFTAHPQSISQIDKSANQFLLEKANLNFEF